MGFCGEMDDYVVSRDDLLDQRSVADVATNKPMAGIDIEFVDGCSYSRVGESVEIGDGSLGFGVENHPDEVRSDESCTAGYQVFATHAAPLSSFKAIEYLIQRRIQKAMRVFDTEIPEVKVLEPVVFEDDRGWFYESWNERLFAEKVDSSVRFVQDNHSKSVQGVLRGLHYQTPNPQGKLVRCIAGKIWDVAVDIRRSSPRFRRWFGVELSAANRRQLWIPPGFAHGFVTLSDEAEVAYKATAFYSGEDDRAIRFDDPELGIEWPIEVDESTLSMKDKEAPLLRESALS